MTFPCKPHYAATAQPWRAVSIRADRLVVQVCAACVGLGPFRSAAAASSVEGRAQSARSPLPNTEPPRNAHVSKNAGLRLAVRRYVIRIIEHCVRSGGKYLRPESSAFVLPHRGAGEAGKVTGGKEFEGVAGRDRSQKQGSRLQRDRARIPIDVLDLRAEVIVYPGLEGADCRHRAYWYW
jgi:hypothetical protein